MRKEEKKAIELLENIKNDSWTTKYIMSSDSKNDEVLLNLIGKLQKENEELNTRLQETIKEKYELKTELYLNSIPKSKIENKIETYIRVVADSNDGDLIHDLRTAIHILEELLEND